MATKQRIRANTYRLWSSLKENEHQVLRALGYHTLPSGYNPIWLAIAGLRRLDKTMLEDQVLNGDLSMSEANAMLDSARKGEALADKLRSVLWRGSSPNKTSIMTAYVVAQTQVLNNEGGPISDGSLGTIRQRWYYSKNPSAVGFKFAAQLLEDELIRSADVVLVHSAKELMDVENLRGGDADGRIMYKTDWEKLAKQRKLNNEPSYVEEWTKEYGEAPRVCTLPKQGWGRAYSQLQSAVMVELVNRGLRYEELWVQDESRTVHHFNPIVQGVHIALLLEKEGLVTHFQDFCNRAGVFILVGMGGNNAYSSVEQWLNAYLLDPNGGYSPTLDNPLHLLELTDHDYFGFVPVAEGAFNQIDHYLPGCVERHRVGILPEQVTALGRSIPQVGYIFDDEKNSATEAWAQEHGIWVHDTCYALEVEALTPKQYFPQIIATIVEIMGGDDELRKKLAEAAEPDYSAVASELRSQYYAYSPYYQMARALENFGRSERYTAEQWFDDEIERLMGDTEDEDSWWKIAQGSEKVVQLLGEIAERITEDDFLRHVEAPDAWGRYRPVSSQEADKAMQELFEDDFEEELLDEHHEYQYGGMSYHRLWVLRYAGRMLDQLGFDRYYYEPKTR